MRQQRMPTKVPAADLLWIVLGVAIAGISVGITLWQVLLTGH